MDQERFDRMTRLFGSAASRRATLAGLAGLAAGALPALAEQAAAKPGRKRPGPEGPCGNGSRKRNICTRDKDCCTGICNTAAGKTNKDGKGRCRCLPKGQTCTEDKNCCGGRACVDGICGGGGGGQCIPEGFTNICIGQGDVCCSPVTCNSTAGACCSDVGGPCSVDAGCCLVGSIPMLVCPSGTCCLPTGAQCVSGEPCCSGNCSGSFTCL
jgi:hypothetical protein